MTKRPPLPRKTKTMKTLALLALLASTVVGCASEPTDSASPDASTEEVDPTCQTIALDGSGYCVDIDPSNPKQRTIEMCGPDSDDVYMICRVDSEKK